jgi:peptidoglycan/LPS O-acetylase OafA/YrhL
MEEKERAYYLDWIRIGVILLLVPFHSAVTFIIHGDAFIKYPQHVPGLDIFTWLLSLWIMPALFLVSGMSAYFSLRSRTGKEFMRERYQKLLLPFFAGVVLICPVMAYLRALFMNTFQGDFLHFYPHFFNGAYPQGNFNWGHLWFLIYLFVFTAILRPLFVYIKTDDVQTRLKDRSAILERGLFVYLPALPLMITEVILRPLFPNVQNLYWDWANFIFSLALVFYGFLLAINYKIVDNIERTRIFSLVLGVVLFALVAIPATSGLRRFMGRTYYAYNTLMVFAWVYAVLGYARALINRRGRIYSYLNNACFPFYIFHFLPVTVAAYFVARMEIDVWWRYLIIVACSYPATFAVYEIVKRIPLIRFLFGIKIFSRLHHGDEESLEEVPS